MAYSGKIWFQPIRRLLFMLLVFSVVIVLFAITENSVQVWINATDAFVAAGIGVVLFITIIRARQDINLALVLVICLQILYSIARSYLFASGLEAASQQIMNLYSQYLHKYSTLKPDPSRVTLVQNLFVNYQVALWGVFQVSSVFLGLLLFNKFSPLKLRTRFLAMPSLLIYPLLASLGMTLYPVSRMWGINLLICLAAAYLIQGAGVLSYFWGDFFARSRMLRTLFIITIIINYPVLVLISFIGILDAWFDFRKIRKMEETHESNPN